MHSSRTKRTIWTIGALLLVVLGFVIGTTVASTAARSVYLAPRQQATPAPVMNPITESERFFSDIYNRVSPSVVSINVSGASSDGSQFGASGTGFVIDQQGHIVTNDHVVADSDNIEVNFLDGTIVRGEIVGLDPDSDLAVIKVDLPTDLLTPVTFGDSDSLFIGQTTLAIGSPFSQRWTLTTGIISALDRTISGQTRYSVGSVIQTDAAINPGNSGGPLLNLQGEVIGVNSQILSETRSNSGVGFAIPSNLVKRVAEILISNGRVDYSYLGIQGASNLDLALIEALNIPNNTRGVVVSRVEQGGPAAAAGLQSASNIVEVNGENVPRNADIIIAIDGIQITDMSGLVSYLAINTTPGQKVDVTILRDGQQITLPVILDSRPSS